MTRFQDRRVWLGGGAVGAALILAVGWFMFVGPELSSASDLHDQATATGQENSVLALKVKSLELKSTQLKHYTTSLREALYALPFDSGLPAFTLQLTAQAKADHVNVSSVVVGGIAPVTSTATTTTPATTDPTTSASTTPTATAATPVTTSATGAVYAIQVTLQSTGTLAHQLAFLGDIRTAGPRRALITSTQISPGAAAGGASIDATLAVTTQLTVFSAPQSPAQVAQLRKLLSGKIGN